MRPTTSRPPSRARASSWGSPIRLDAGLQRPLLAAAGVLARADGHGPGAARRPRRRRAGGLRRRRIVHLLERRRRRLTLVAGRDAPTVPSYRAGRSGSAAADARSLIPARATAPATARSTPPTSTCEVAFDDARARALLSPRDPRRRPLRAVLRPAHGVRRGRTNWGKRLDEPRGGPRADGARRRLGDPSRRARPDRGRRRPEPGAAREYRRIA